MFRYFSAILLMVCCILPSIALANPPADHEKMHKELIDFKIKYLIQETGIDADKQAEFERLYRQMEQERHDLFKSVFSKAKAAQKADAGDSELAAAADAMASLKQREGAIEVKYYQLFKKFMTTRQLYNMKRAEERFNRKVMSMRGKDAPPRQGHRGKKKSK